jgi:aspartyl-tRNA(Asn)/glutamyl-tRNA(Gln) amidotransferase subunit A
MSNSDRELAFLSLSEAADRLDGGDVSSVELTQHMLDRIAALDGKLNAFITVLADQALESAREADARRKEGARGRLLGVPIALKDLFNTAGIRTTGGARILADNVPERDATVVTKLREAGAVILGKTNMMEFAYGYPHPDFGETSNPWALDRTAGGSSGGSAAAVCAGLAYGALGSDTGGSIRSPAAYCGLSGLKPTYGRVSRHGVLPLSWSLDHVGPLARTSRDAAIMLDAIAGFDPRDPASARVDHNSTFDSIDANVSGLRVGIVDELFERYVQPEVRDIALAAAKQLGDLVAGVEAVAPPHLDLVMPTISPIVQAEAASYHRQTLSTRPNDFSQSVRDNLRLGAMIPAIDYIDAQRLRRWIRDGVESALQTHDVLVFPTQPIVAPALDSYQTAASLSDDVLDVEIGHTGIANLTGHPALSILAGFTPEGLPVGLQLTGRMFDEGTILRLGHAFEAATEWHRRRPPHA